MCYKCECVKCGLIVILILLLMSTCTTVSGFESRQPSHYLRQSLKQYPWSTSTPTSKTTQIPYNIPATMPRIGSSNQYLWSRNPTF